MPNLESIKSQIREKLETPTRLLIEKGKSLGFSTAKVSPTRTILKLPGKVGDIQEKIAKFLAPQTPEEEALDLVTSIMPLGKVTKLEKPVAKTVSRIIPKIEEKLPGNLRRLNISQESKQGLVETFENIRPQLEKIKGGVLKNEEVLEAARFSDILIKKSSRETTLKSEAALLRTRQHLAELAKDNKLTPEFLDSLKVVSTEATKRGRELQALGIEADPSLGNIKSKVVKDLLQLGKTTDDILKASEGIDFNDVRQVTEFYRKFVKPTLPELIDEYRYVNLLSSPKTHIVNAFSNMLQVGLLRPATRLASGMADTIASKITGKEQQFYVSQIGPYYKGAFNSLGQATDSFIKALRGQSLILRPDIRQIPTNAKFLRPFQFVPRLLEASDVFFRTLATQGEIEALMSKGIPEAEVIEKAAETAGELVFRKALDPSNKTGQGVVLSGIDKMTNAVYALRRAPLTKWFVPFVQTPMNILKQGIEFSPLGLTTLPGHVNKIEQLGKTMIGSTIFASAGWLAMNDRTTWAVPTGEKDKAAFYAAGLQPYSVKVGDKWISYSRLGPLAYPLAMAAAIKFYTQQNPASVSDTDLQKTTKILSGIAQFFSDQSYMEGMGELLGFVRGETGAPLRVATNIPSQLIPLASLQRWLANIIDPIYRKTSKQITVEGIINNLRKGIPGLTFGLEPHRTPLLQPSRRQFPVFGAFSPVGVTEEKPSERLLFDLLQQKRRMNKLKQSLKEKLQQRIQERLPAALPRI